ncbi:MAG: hypothetical protein QOG72_2608 [Sphingomonadales bacterium]|nr:hypothetical protein [Sphingomonadales bacterium]
MRVPLALAAASFSVAACSPEASPPAPDKAREAVAQPAAAAKTPPPRAKAPLSSGQMQREALAAEGPPPPLPAAGAGERRCGWLMNPTPGNWWLFDGHGEWILGTQGGEPVPGMEDMPDMSTADWVETNGHYGYGCACMTISYDPATQRVTRVADAKPKPLRQCRADKGLPRP